MSQEEPQPGTHDASGGYGSGLADQPIKVIVAFPAGGIVDVVARVVGDQLSSQLRQPIVRSSPASASTSPDIVSRVIAT